MSKVKKIGGEDKQLQRFISNLVPGNSYQAHLPGDDVHLPYLGQLSMLSIHPDEELVVDSEDLTSCVPVLPSQILGSLPPLESQWTAVYLAWPEENRCTRPWLSAVALTQAIARHLVFELSGVKVESEVRKTAPFPAEDEFSVIYFLRRDSEDGCRTGRSFGGPPSDNHLAYQDTCHELGLPLNDGKRVVAAIQEERAGTFFLARDKQAQLVGLTAAVLEAEKVIEFELRHWTGKVIWDELPKTCHVHLGGCFHGHH